MKKIPMRRCVGCMESKPKSELVRIAGFEGKASMDLTGKAKGRGVYLCKNEECFLKAKKKKAIERGLGIELTKEEAERLMEEILKK
ncbi:MAG: YlxR family protein [Anaerovoracaceae bacterium]